MIIIIKALATKYKADSSSWRKIYQNTTHTSHADLS